ncbi:hypothetical protein C8R45DRAFT_917590 [Mycena sanguinolenta]|nr:hypothetical protein C8R45DRAFT_917590 [Mycena sanguinolenta]
MDWELTTTAAAGIVAGVLLARQQRTERHHERRLYLTRAQLLPDPRHDTAWQVLYSSKSDRAFITTMGFDTQTFQQILDAGFSDTWTMTPIPRGDTAATGKPRPGARSLDAAGALGLALHFVNSTMREISLQQIHLPCPHIATDQTCRSVRYYMSDWYQKRCFLLPERSSGASGEIDGRSQAIVYAFRHYSHPCRASPPLSLCVTLSIGSRTFPEC